MFFEKLEFKIVGINIKENHYFLKKTNFKIY